MTDTDNTEPGQAEGNGRRDTNPRRELVREELLDIATRMFDEQGFDRVSMAMIAREVGLGRSAIYHYFASKDDILASIVESEAQAPVGRIQQLANAPGLNVSTRLRNVIVDGVVRRLSLNSRFVRLVRLEAQIPMHLRQDYDRSRRAIYDEYLKLIDAGIASREFRAVDSHVAAFGIIGMANWTSRWFQADGRLGVREVAEVIADLALASIQSPQGDDSRMQAVHDRLSGIIGELAALSETIAPRRTDRS